jgi:hypothetical protein
MFLMNDNAELNQMLSKACSSPPMMAKSRGPRASRDEYDDDDEFEDQITQSYSQWTTSNGRIFVPASTTKHKLPPGVYEIDSSPNIGLYFEKIPVKTEGLLRFPDTNSDKVVDEIQRFWSPEVEQKFKTYGLAYKRGILLWGPPGSGKSCTLQLIMADVIKRGGIVVKFDDPYLFIDGMRVLRRIQPDTPVVVMLEDIDSIIKMYNESEVLNILDGVNETERMVFLATTNYPEELGHRIVNRPSRFDKRFKIGFPSAASRKMYFEHLIGGKKKVKELGINLKEWVEDTDKFSIAHLKELFIAVHILGDNYKDAVETLKTMREDIDTRENEDMMSNIFTGRNKTNKEEDVAYYDDDEDGCGDQAG